MNCTAFRTVSFFFAVREERPFALIYIKATAFLLPFPSCPFETIRTARLDRELNQGTLCFEIWNPLRAVQADFDAFLENAARAGASGGGAVGGASAASSPTASAPRTKFSALTTKTAEKLRENAEALEKFQAATENRWERWCYALSGDDNK